MAEEPSVLQRHRRAIAGFDTVLADAGPWDSPSPCAGWTASDVVKHVTDIHTVMAQRLGEPSSGGGWPAARDAALRALATPGALDQVIDVPNGGEMTAGRFVNVVTTDVLVHTWDLARAFGTTVQLDPELVERAYNAAMPMDELIRSSGMFGPRIDFADDADPQSKMLAFFGRDPR
jgi:uncharacterized protein (TIGR03086 family)